MVRAMLDQAASLGIGFSQVVSLGDMAVDFYDTLNYLVTMRQVRDFVCRRHHA